MCTKICLIVSTIFIAILLLSPPYVTEESNVTVSSIGVVQQMNPQSYNYVITVSGSSYQMIDGATGQVLFQSESSYQVFSNVIGNCSAGYCVDVKCGTYLVQSTWVISNINRIFLNFENGAKLVAANGLNSNILELSNSNNDVISGVTIDGNAANNPSSSGSPSGVWIAGSNDLVENATVYDVRVFGVTISTWAIATTVNSVKSGVIYSTIYNCGANGVQLSGYSGDYAINDNIYGCSDVGISTYEANSTIAGNYIHDLNGTTGIGGNAEYGIAVEGDSASYGYGALISNNQINNTNEGIVINTSGIPEPYNNNNVLNNYITNSRFDGIEVGSSFNVLYNNTVDGVIRSDASYNAAGINLDNSGSFNTVTGNRISQSDCWGIEISSGSTNNTITGNYVFDNGLVNAGDLNEQSGVLVCGNYNSVNANHIYDDRSGSSRTQLIGIELPSWVSPRGNTCTGNFFSNLVDYNIYDANNPQNNVLTT